MTTNHAQTLLAAGLLLAASTVAAAAGEATEPQAAAWLRDASVSCAPDGTYYLTGTAGTLDKSGKVDFDYNRGVPLWRSADLRAWTSLGYGWDRVKRFAKSSRHHAWTWWSTPAERIDGLPALAATAPRLYCIGGDWFLLCAQNNQGVFVFRSESGKPEGPYADHGYLATRGGWPSFFIDDDNAVFLVLADGWIARMRSDLKQTAEDIRPLLRAADASGSGRLTLGDCGVALFKRGGRYQLLAARWVVRDGHPSHDAVLWASGPIYGPYHQTAVALLDTGPVSVFQDADGEWKAVSSRPFNPHKTAPRVVPIPGPQ